MPRTTLDIVRDLHALLRAAGAPRPFVLAGHSFGGMVARLYATNHPRAVAGLVSVDAQNEDYAAALKRLLPPDVYAANVLDPQPPPGLNYPEVEILDLEPSAAQMRQAQADTSLRPMPFVVLSHSRTIPNPFDFPPDFPIDALESAFQDSQDMLAKPRAGRQARDRHREHALHPARSAHAGHGCDPPGGQEGPQAMNTTVNCHG